MLKGKTVLLGVTGSIAAYKIASLASALKKLHADVHVLMTENATNRVCSSMMKSSFLWCVICYEIISKMEYVHQL